MFVFSYATLALAAVGSVSALVVPRKEPPKGWLPNILEDYNVYHKRYLALDCQAKHNTAFFNKCCHPLLKNQSLSSRPAYCTPSTSTSASAEPTATDDGDDDSNSDSDCDDDDTTTTQESTTPISTPTSTSHSASSTQEGKTLSAHPTSTDAPTTTVKPTTTQKPSSSSSSSHAAASPSKSANAGSSGSSVNTGGFATFFFQNGVAGACGTVHSDNDLIAAIDEKRYGNSGLKSSLCGKKVNITNPANGKSVTVTIVDDCPTCVNSNSIDLSVAAFEKIATKEQGMVAITWEFQ